MKSSSEAKKPITKHKRNDDIEIPSDDDDGLEITAATNTNNDISELTFSGDEEETPQDKRLRLAKQYLEEIEKIEAEHTETVDKQERISKRLHDEYLEGAGKLRRNVCDSLKHYDETTENIKLKHAKQHLSICCLALSPEGEYMYSGAKTAFVLKWHLASCRVVASFNVQPYAENAKTNVKRRSHVIAICLSSDGRFLALADGGNTIQIWCPKELKHLKTFHGHRDTVTGLVFRRQTHDLYSCSRDRSVKIWSVDEMAYVESL